MTKSTFITAIILGVIISALVGFTIYHDVLTDGDSPEDIEAVECEISRILLQSNTAIDESPYPREYSVVGTDPESGVSLVVTPNDPSGRGGTILIKIDPSGNITTVDETPETWRAINNVGKNLAYINQLIAKAKIMACLNVQFPGRYRVFDLHSHDWKHRFEDAVKPWVSPDPHALWKAILYSVLIFLGAVPCCWLGLTAIKKSWYFSLARTVEFTNALRGK